MMVSPSRIEIFAAFAAIYLVWGSTYLALAVALASVPPFLLMGARSLAGGLILFAGARLAGSPPPSLRVWLRAATCGLFLFVGCHGVLAYAQQHVPTGIAAILLATIPFWIAVLPGADRPTVKRLTLLVPGFVGVGLIAWRQSDASSAGPQVADILLLLGASASWAAGTILSQRWSDATSPIALSGMELIAGGIALSVVSVVLGEPAAFRITDISGASLAAWAHLTIAGTVVSFAAYIWLLNQVPATLVATYTFINPIIAVLLGWTFLDERPGGSMAFGGGLVIASVASLLLAEHRSTKQTTHRAPAHYRTQPLEARS
jgi:drug/metabolite transporter (DMT)-like permease